MTEELLDNLKKQLRISDNDFDEQLRICVSAALTAAESSTGIHIQQETLSWDLPFEEEMDLPEFPADIQSVKLDGKQLSEDQYVSDGLHLYLAEGLSGLHVTVTVKVGYQTLPDDIRMAVLLAAARYFTNPVDSVENLPKASENLLRPYRRYNV